MLPNTNKLGISVRIDDDGGPLRFEFDVDSKGQRLAHGYRYELDYHPRLTLSVLECPINSSLQITEISWNGVELQNLSKFCRILTAQNTVINSYGWIGCPGMIIFKFRQNALVHNYLHWFKSRCDPVDQ